MTSMADVTNDSSGAAVSNPPTSVSAHSGRPAVGQRRSGWPAGIAGATGMVFVGGSVAVSSTLSEIHLFTAQAVRYAIAALLLVVFGRLTGRRLKMPRGAEWWWLMGVAGTGLVVFNIALVHGARHAEPAVLGVAVACVPLLLAVIGPLLEGGRPTGVVLVAALVVTVGAAIVQGLGRSDAAGLAWAVVVLACEAGFTLLALPVLRRHGPWGVSVHATWIATVAFCGVGLVGEGPGAVTRLRIADWLAVGYLAVGVTALAFVLWYSCVRTLGASRAGLLTGLAPISAAAVGVLLGGPIPDPRVWAGIGVVAAGLVIGMARGGARSAAGVAGRSGAGPARPHDVPAHGH